MPNPGSITNGVPDPDRMVRNLRDTERTAQENAAARTLARSQMGSGGTMQIDGSLAVSGSITVPGTLASAGAVAAGTTVTAGTDVNVGANITVNSGSIFSTYMLTHPVISGYFAAYFDGTGRLGITPSSRRFKREIEPKPYTLEQIQRIQVVSYRLRAAYILYGEAARYEIGVIAEQLVDEGFPEFVLFDRKGRPASVAYDRLALVALQGVQQLTAELGDLRAELKALKEKVDTLG